MESICKFCPQCGKPQGEDSFTVEQLKFECADCGFVFYRNSAATASMILKCGDEFLFSVRGREPSQGKLDFPGGFVDAGESVEEAFVREMEEELGWCPENFQYAFSSPNTYLYQEVLYHTSDIFYFAEVNEKPRLEAQDDVQELIWLALDQISDDMLAFDSMRQAVEQLTTIFQ